MSRLEGGNAYKCKVITALKDKKLILTYSRDGLKGYRLTARGKRLLKKENPKRFESILEGTTEINTPKSELTRRLRLHQMAQVLITFQKAEIPFFSDLKPALFTYPIRRAQPNEVVIPAFYTSREIKQLGPQLIKARNSRMVGVLLTERCIFVIYNTGNSLLRWSYHTEVRAKALMDQILSHAILQDIYCDRDIRGLMFCDNMEMAPILMQSKGGKNRSFFSLDTSYDHMHLLPSTSHGDRVLKVLCSEKLVDQLNALLLSDLIINPRYGSIDCDAVDADGNPILLGYDFDMIRISRFLTSLRIYKKSGTIICYDFQADALRGYCGDRVKFQTMNLDKFERRFLQ